MLKAQANIRRINEARQADATKQTTSKEDNDLDLPGEATSAMKDVCDMNQKSHCDLTLEERETMLNADQTRIFQKVKSHLLHQKRHEEKMCPCDMKPLRMFISGVGGTGKSFLIEAITVLVGRQMI